MSSSDSENFESADEGDKPDTWDEVDKTTEGVQPSTQQASIAADSAGHEDKLNEVPTEKDVQTVQEVAEASLTQSETEKDVQTVQEVAKASLMQSEAEKDVQTVQEVAEASLMQSEGRYETETKRKGSEEHVEELQNIQKNENSDAAEVESGNNAGNVQTTDISSEGTKDLHFEEGKDETPVVRCDEVAFMQKHGLVERKERPKTRPKKSGPMKLGTKITKRSSEEEKSYCPVKESLTVVHSDTSKELSPREEPPTDEQLETSKPRSTVKKPPSSAVPEDETVESCITTGHGAPSDVKYTSVFDKIAKTEGTNENSNWNWGWGSSLLSTATSITSQVSQGFSSVLESVESGIGVPDPEDLAKEDKMLEKTVQDMLSTSGESQLPADKKSARSVPFGNLVSGVSQFTKVLENAGSKVIVGGLDTLEAIGRKTMDVLQEGDPLLKKKRALLRGNRPILSLVLREAKERDEQRQEASSNQPKFERFFDQYHGLVHLEALEMLSKECEVKIQSRQMTLDGEELQTFLRTLEEIQACCDTGEVDSDIEGDEDHEFVQSVAEQAGKLGISSNADKLVRVQMEVVEAKGALDIEGTSPEDIQKVAVESLARLTAAAIDYYHRTGELLLVQDAGNPDWAKPLNLLTITICKEVNVLSTDFTKKIVQLGTSGSHTEIVTNVFLEASNSSTYIQDAFQLLVPILQWSIVGNGKI